MIFQFPESPAKFLLVLVRALPRRFRGRGVFDSTLAERIVD